jgi:hypothetical protein
VIFGGKFEFVRVPYGMGCVVVHSIAAQKIQIDIRLAFRLTNARTANFLCYSVFADTFKHLCLPTNLHKAIRGTYRVVRCHKTHQI